MDLTLVGTDNALINMRRIFWMLVIFELICMSFLLFGGYETKIWFAGILLVPVFVVFIPLEPAVGLAIMIIVTGLDFMGVIAKDTSAMYYRLTYFHLAIFVTFISSFTNTILQKRITIPSLSVWSPLLLFMVMYAVSLTRTPNMEDALFTFIRVGMLSLTILMIVLSVQSRWKVHFLVWVIILATFVISGVSLYQMFHEGTFFAPVVIKVANALGLPVFRSTATFMNPNSLACFLMTGVVMSFSLLFIKKCPKVLRLLIIIAVVTTTLGLIVSFSRGGWLSTFAALVLVVALHRKWSFFGYFAIFLLLCVVVITIKVPNLWDVVLERFGTIFNADQDASSTARIALIKTSIRMWMDYPLFGVGLRGFPTYFSTYIDPSMPHVLSELREAHTIQTEILAEFGLIGIVISTWLFMSVLLEGIRQIGALRNNALRCMEIGFLSLFVGFIVNFTFATDITNNMFWMTVGFIYAVPIADRRLADREIRADTVAANSAEA